MLLNHFKTASGAARLSSAASALHGSARSGSVESFAVARKGSMQVKAMSSSSSGSAEGGAGWSESSSIGKVKSKVASVVDNVLHYGNSKHDNETVQYKGTAVIMKLLKGMSLDGDADAKDDASEIQGNRVSVQLVSTEIDPKTGKAMLSGESNLERWNASSDTAAEKLTFKLQFSVPRKFGVPAAILVKNHHPNEFQLQSFSLDLPDTTKDVYYWTNSWVANTGNRDGRVFFLNKACLPCDTPATLKEYREKELQNLRGNGEGERKQGDRIYDYDVYNDLSKASTSPELARRPLGGTSDFPFPRRLRTGRPPQAADPKSESRDDNIKFYLPRDEGFDLVKMRDQGGDAGRATGHAKAATGEIPVTSANFESVEAIKRAYAKDAAPSALYPVPQVIQVDDTAWQTDAEFAREFLAGMNPIEIKLVKEFPVKSSLSATEHGDPTSAITAEHINSRLEGLSVQQALSQKKLFLVDYHDVFLPLVEKINAQPGRKTYAGRTLLFKSSDGTLKVLAIELVLPGVGGAKNTSRVFTPPTDSSKTDYVWELAKAHFMSNEMAVHQVTSHFGRSHAMTEPVIIATNRQLSKLHPIYQLMAPHFRFTLEINATARRSLICAGGTFEKTFTPGAYFLDLVVSFYRDAWDFESQALPKDLLKRGVAVADSKAKEGVKLVIEDYPYATDGLELWGAMKTWNSEYIDVYYKDDKAILKDEELQNWWTEFRTVAHADMKDAPGWPELKTRKDLAQIVTIMQWLCTCQHAVVNFSQYDYGGFMPQHPSLTRRLIPEEGTPEWEEFQANPEKFYMSTISDAQTALGVMTVFEITCNHSTHEEYISDRHPTWTQNQKVEAAFERYKSKLSEIDLLIKSRNEDKKLKNRAGVAGQLPFQLLRPSSGPGMTAMGIPNSITV